MYRPTRSSGCSRTICLNLYVRSQDNQMVPIGAVAHLGSEVAPSLITLYNLYPSSTIIGAPARGVSSGQGLDGDWKELRKRHCRATSPTNGPRCPIRKN